MSEHNTGTVAVTNASTTVVGTSTTWSTEVAAGDIFTIVASGVSYIVGSVTDDTHIELTGAYAGTTESGISYTISTSFTSPDSIPYPQLGDTQPATILARMAAKIQDIFTGIKNGTEALASPDINGGTIDDATIGATTPSTGAFTTLSASGLLSANGGQVAFPATQNPSADANTLDDYEEGTWTPTVQDDTLSDAEGQTYTINVGYYTKIGNVVHVEGHIIMSSLGTLTTTEQTKIAGLPFTTRNTGHAVGTVVVGQAASLSITAGYTVTGRVEANSTVATLKYWDGTGGAGPFRLSNLTASGNIYFSIDYSTAQ